MYLQKQNDLQKKKKKRVYDSSNTMMQRLTNYDCCLQKSKQIRTKLHWIWFYLTRKNRARPEERSLRWTAQHFYAEKIFRLVCGCYRNNVHWEISLFTYYACAVQDTSLMNLFPYLRRLHDASGQLTARNNRLNTKHTKECDTVKNNHNTTCH